MLVLAPPVVQFRAKPLLRTACKLDQHECLSDTRPTTKHRAGVDVPSAQLSPQLDPEQVKQQMHLMAHADRAEASSVFIKGNHFVATPRSDAAAGEGGQGGADKYSYVLSVDSVSYQGVIYRVRCALGTRAIAAWTLST
jgi:hypothetical protein